MDHSRINPYNTNNTSQSRSTNTSSSAMTGNGVRRGNVPGNASAPSVQKSGQFGVVKAATSLQLGDVIKGEISDLTGNEITLTLENNTMIRGQISDSSLLSIGQTAAFKLDGLSPAGVILSPVSGYTENELTLINKALQEAGLPASEHNQAAVKALMDNLMPINREAIQQLMQQAFDMKSTDMGTLALMKRLMMPVTPDSLEQFGNYRQGIHTLTEQLNNFAGELPVLLQALSENGSASLVADFAKQCLQIAQPLFTETWDGLTVSSLSEQDKETLLTLLSQTELPEQILKAASDGTLSVQDALKLVKDAIAAQKAVAEQQSSEESENVSEDPNIPTDAKASSTETENTGISKLFHSLQDTVSHSLSDTLGKFRAGQSTSVTEENTDNETLLRSLSELTETDASARGLVRSVLSEDARSSFAALLSKLPVSPSFLAQILSGNASIQETMHVLRNVISLSDPSLLKEVLRSDEFASLFAKSLENNWSITPDHLSQKEQPGMFLEQIQSQMHSLEQLIGSSLSGSDSRQFEQNAHDIQSNIQFMKELNETFTYLQLPIKLPSQTAGSELYVYTQKEKRQANPEKMRVLLHLDLEHLGKLEIRLDKDHQNIAANFRLDDEFSVELLRKNAALLTQNLADMGYQTNIQVTKQEEAPVSMDDFLNTRIKTNATEEMKRFSFDIRA